MSTVTRCPLPLLLLPLLLFSVLLPNINRISTSISASSSSSLEAAEGAGSILVLGATGRTGSLLYKQLKHDERLGGGVEIRALVRNVTKAKEILHCNTCDESDGIYQGDITNITTLWKAFENVSTVAIATGMSGRGQPTVEQIKAVEFLGVQNAVRALAQNTNQQQFGGIDKNLRVVLISSRGTTTISTSGSSGRNIFEEILFYKLNAEAFLGSVGLTTSIVKPCGLGNTPGQNSTLLALHDDAPTPTGSQMISRADVARVMAELIVQPPTQNLRFDICSIVGPATTDLKQLIDSAKWSWEEN